MDINIEKVTVLQITATPYDFNGKKGTSYKADVVFNGGVATFKATEDVFKDIGEQKNVECDSAVFKLEAYKMEPKLILTSVTYK